MKKRTIITIACCALALFALVGCTQETQVLERPPALTVRADDASVNAWRGSSEWQTASRGTASDHVHPLDAMEEMTPLACTPGATVTLVFETAAPDSVSVRAWSEDLWDEEEAESSAVPCTLTEEEDGTWSLVLNDEDALYEIRANWTSDDRYGGHATYAFVTTNRDTQA